MLKGMKRAVLFWPRKETDMSMPRQAEIVKTTAPRITVSSLQDLACPKRYKRKRIDRIWEPRDAIYAVANGTAVHRVLRDVYEARRGWEVSLKHLEDQALDSVYATKYPVGFDRDGAVARVIASVRGFVEADDEEAIEGTFDLERQGQFEVKDKRTGRVLFVASAKLDRTLIRASCPDRLVVRESKTTAQRISLKEVFLQLWVARKMHPGCASYAIEFDFLDADLRVVRETVEWETVQGQGPIVLRQALRVIDATEYPAIPCESCTYCEMRDECTKLPAEEMDGEICQGLPAVDMREDEELF